MTLAVRVRYTYSYTKGVALDSVAASCVATTLAVGSHIGQAGGGGTRGRKGFNPYPKPLNPKP